MGSRCKSLSHESDHELFHSLNFSRLFPLPGVGRRVKVVSRPRPTRGKGKRRLKFRLWGKGVKSAYESSDSSRRSLSRFLQHKATRSICVSTLLLVFSGKAKYAYLIFCRIQVEHILENVLRMQHTDISVFECFFCLDGNFGARLPAGCIPWNIPRVTSVFSVFTCTGTLLTCIIEQKIQWLSESKRHTHIKLTVNICLYRFS